MPLGWPGQRCFPRVCALGYDTHMHIQYMQTFVSNYQAGASGRPIPPLIPSQASTGNENVSPNTSVPEDIMRKRHI